MSGISPPIARSFSGHQSPVFGGGESLLSAVPPLDATTVDYWDAAILAPTASDPGVFLVGGVVDSWKGHVAGIVVSAPAAGQRPIYTTDSNFKNTSVVQGTTASARGLRNASAGTIAASGSRPYTISVIRIHTLPGASVLWGVIGLGVSATSDPQYNVFQTFGGSEWRPTVISVNVQATATADTSKHVLECWADGTNANGRDNNVLSTATNAAALGANMTAIGIGLAASSNTHSGNINHVFHMLCSSKPSDAYIANLKNWLAVKKGTLA